MRRRVIDPAFWSDSKITELSFNARLLYIGLWQYADDEGLFALEDHVGFLDLRAARADRLHFPALEHDPRLVALLDEVVVKGFAVFDDRHGAR